MVKFIFWLFPLLVLFLFVTSSSEAQAPRRYYDWSSTFDTRKDVLGIVYAQQATDSAKQQSPENFSQFTGYFIGSNLTPANPFHFIKTMQETIQLTFTFDPVKKEEIRIAIAGERLDEMEKLAENNQPSALVAAAKGYETSMNAVVEGLENLHTAKKDVSTLLTKIETETAGHDVILEEVHAKASPQAQSAIQGALESAWQSIDTSYDIAGRPAVPPDVIDRIQALKAQGLLTEEEAAKLISVKTRSEARSEIAKYVKEGIVPEADFLRLNEHVKTFYPDEFYKIHEVKRFYELKRLETDKPDDQIITRIQEFAKTYKPGDVVPADIRKYWVPAIRLEELQNTLRPDLIDPNLIKNKEDDYKKFTEIVERFKPKPADILYLQNYIEKNKTGLENLPPEYQRMYNLGQKYGAQCGVGQRWVPAPQSGGYCIPEGVTANELPRIEDFAKNRSCNGNVVTAKAPNGACTAYPSDCIPPGWTRTETCGDPQPISERGTTNAIGRRISCSSNTHWVPIAYLPDGGYCVPNYTAIDAQKDGVSEGPCPSGYHRNYGGGPCLQDYNPNNISNPLSPLTANPGAYPNPLYPPGAARCGGSSHWVPEPFNPAGGYCAPDNPSYRECPAGEYSGPGGVCTPQAKSSEASRCAQSGKYWDGQNCQEQRPTGYGQTPGNGLPRADMGNCRTPGECYNWCKANPGKCPGFQDNSPRPPDSSPQNPSCQQITCGTGYSWDRGTCTCKPSCPAGTSWSGAYCMKDSSSYTPPGSTTSCQGPSTGCGTGYSWDRGTCTCKPSCPAGTSWTGSYCMNDSSPSSGGGSTPSGYGSCGSGQHWDSGRSMCVSDIYNSSNPEQMCRNTAGCRWENNACNCSPQSTSTQNTPVPQPTTPPQAQPTQPPPTSPPQEQPTQPPPTSPPQEQPTQPPPTNPPPGT